MPKPTSNLDSTSEAVSLVGIRRAAEETLAAWPEARAAVLFGSRARGDHQPTSDWDVAFITRSGGDRVTDIPAGLPIEALPCDVQALALPEILAHRKALAIGHVAHPVVRDGMLLAGRWTRPETVGEPKMEPGSYRQFVQNASGYIQVAAIRAAQVGEDGDWEGSYPCASSFVNQTADAAEHLARAMLGRHGIDPKWSHSVAGLADQAEEARLPDLAKDIEAMDGFTRRDHVAGYGPTQPERLDHAVDRLPVVIRRLEMELASAANSRKYKALFPGLANRVARTAAGAVNTIRLAILRDGLDPEPPSGHHELAPLIHARDMFVAELLLLRDGLQPLIPEPGGNRGKGKTVFG